jgi:protein-S-isoprenylcysteine O-methyltransferase Ste14
MTKPTGLNERVLKEIQPRIVNGILGLILFTLLWFGIAGRVTWWQGWAFLFTFITYVSILVWRLLKVNPELVR